MWFTGYNSNVPGHEYGKTRYLVYNGGAPKYVSRITEVAENNYEEIVFSSSSKLFDREDSETGGIGEDIPD